MALFLGYDYNEVGIDNKVAFKSALTKADQGKPVKMTANETVGLAGDGEKFIGKVLIVEGDGACTVELGQYTEFTYTGAAPTVGTVKLVADGLGGVKVDAVNGKEYLAVTVDTTNTKVGIFLK